MSARRGLLLWTACVVMTLGLSLSVRSRPARPDNSDAMEQQVALGASELIGASSESLHELLDKFFPDSFRHGVWVSEQEALEAVYRTNAALASNIVRLAKRDGSNISTSLESATFHTTTGTLISSSVTQISKTSSTVLTTTFNPSASASSALPPDSSSTVPDLSSIAPTSSVPASLPLSNSLLSITSTAIHSSVLTTGTYTSTKPGGSVVIITATSYLDMGNLETATATKMRASAGLQNSAAHPRIVWDPAESIGCLLGVLLVLFV